jgi:hypothetical protein
MLLLLAQHLLHLPQSLVVPPEMNRCQAMAKIIEEFRQERNWARRVRLGIAGTAASTTTLQHL